MTRSDNTAPIITVYVHSRGSQTTSQTQRRTQTGCRMLASMTLSPGQKNSPCCCSSPVSPESSQGSEWVTVCIPMLFSLEVKGCSNDHVFERASERASKQAAYVLTWLPSPPVTATCSGLDRCVGADLNFLRWELIQPANRRLVKRWKTTCRFDSLVLFALICHPAARIRCSFHWVCDSCCVLLPSCLPAAVRAPSRLN